MTLAAFGTWGGWAALTALGTFGAVIVAVGLQWWIGTRERRSKPELTLAFDEYHFVDEGSVDGSGYPWLRLAVTNAAGKRTAENVEVIIEFITEYAMSTVGFGGRMVWLANAALSWANSLDPYPRMSIPPGATRYVDVANWNDASVPLHMSLRVTPAPLSGRHRLVAGGWNLRLAVAATNADATVWNARVSFEEDAHAGLARPKNVLASVARA